MDKHDILTAEQSAELLQVSIDTMRKLLREGQIPARKVGREYRILRTNLEAWLGAPPSRATKTGNRERAMPTAENATTGSTTQRNTR